MKTQNIVRNISRLTAVAATLGLTASAVKSADMPGNTTPGSSNQPYVAPGASGVPTPPGNAALQRLEQQRSQTSSSSNPTMSGNMTTMSANTTATAKRDECVKEIQDAAAFYDVLQQKPESAVPPSVLANAKAVVFIDRWAASAVIGGTGGRAIVFKRGSDGKFHGPAFYDVAGGSIGAQLGVSHVKTLAALMTDKALKTLEDSKFLWSGNLRAVAGNSSAASSTVDNNTDIYLYQTASGLDVGATLAATRLSPDEKRNLEFYNQNAVTPAEIFAGKVTTAPEAKEFIAMLSKAPVTTASQ